jgi:aminoglycoside/choline kinase family phosphotransferase
MKGKYTQDMVYKPIGIIDFGDALVGDRLYDIPTIHIDMFSCDKKLTLDMMNSYGIEKFKVEV